MLYFSFPVLVFFSPRCVQPVENEGDIVRSGFQLFYLSLEMIHRRCNIFCDSFTYYVLVLIRLASLSISIASHSPRNLYCYLYHDRRPSPLHHHLVAPLLCITSTRLSLPFLIIQLFAFLWSSSMI